MSEDPIRLIQEENRQTQAFFDSLNAGIQRSVQNQFEVQRSALNAATTVANLASAEQTLKFNAQNARARIAVEEERLRQSNRDLLMREAMAPVQMEIQALQAETARTNAATSKLRAETIAKAQNNQAQDEFLQTISLDAMAEFNTNRSNNFLREVGGIHSAYRQEYRSNPVLAEQNAARKLGELIDDARRNPSKYPSSPYSASQQATLGNLFGKEFSDSYKQSNDPIVLSAARFNGAEAIFEEEQDYQRFLLGKSAEQTQYFAQGRDLANSLQAELTANQLQIESFIKSDDVKDFLRGIPFSDQQLISAIIPTADSQSGLPFEDKKRILNKRARLIRKKNRLQEAIRSGIDPVEAMDRFDTTERLAQAAIANAQPSGANAINGAPTAGGTARARNAIVNAAPQGDRDLSDANFAAAVQGDRDDFETDVRDAVTTGIEPVLKNLGLEDLAEDIKRINLDADRHQTKAPIDTIFGGDINNIVGFDGFMGEKKLTPKAVSKLQRTIENDLSTVPDSKIADIINSEEFKQMALKSKPIRSAFASDSQLFKLPFVDEPGMGNKYDKVKGSPTKENAISLIADVLTRHIMNSINQG